MRDFSPHRRYPKRILDCFARNFVVRADAGAGKSGFVLAAENSIC